MANKDDYLTDYRCFFENFAQTYNPHDQLPVKLASYKLASYEVVGGIIDWTTQYLNQKKCPQSLLSPLLKIIIEEVRALCRKQTLACGFNPSSNAYDPLRLMQCVVTKTNEICLRYLDNSKLCSLPSPGAPYNTVSVCAIKNNRRRMEDRHVVIHDLNALFIDEEVSPSSYYAIFDGHAGHDAAAYSCAHLHQFLGESKYFISNPEQALREAFLKTDTLFNDKCNAENFRSGTTALCVLLKHKEKTLYIAWVGDSQAVLVSQGQCLQCVQPHKPCREDEKHRIEQEGGTVIYWGTWRVNGQLAVSRAIGDVEYKPYVTAVPDIIEIPLSGVEDFIILGCDGLWDVMSEKDAARHVYEEIIHNPDDIESVSQHLVQLAKEKGSFDNISVIVVFLREPSKVAAEAHWATRHNIIMDTLDNANATNPFANSNNGDIKQKEDYVMNIGEGFKQNGTESLEFLRATNGKRTSHEFDDDEDLGPETNVDTIDDVLLTTTVLSAKNLMEEIVNNNSSLCENEKATLETDTDLLEKQNLDDFENIQFMRDETPTPPADFVQDASGLIDNVAESGEESEDEWNYIKGDQAEKENIDPSQSDKEICELTSNLDTDMSQLNPNAAEFVPISPKRTTASPIYEKLTDDLVIAQSPKRGLNNDYDINVPNLQDFESEIKLRPSDVEEYVGDNETDNASTLTSQELMENLLNGKSIDEIEFQPNNTPVKFINTGEFHFGQNSTPFTTPVTFMDQSETLSTKAVIGNDSTYLDDTNLNESQTSIKEDDPMSMSFYQDKEDPDNNPFDLNKVQVLPDNIDDFLEKPKEHEENLSMDTISDLPEHNPLEHADVAKSPVLEEQFDPIIERELSPISVELQEAEPIVLAQDEALETLQSPIFSEHSPNIQSPIPDEHESGVADLSSPVPEIPESQSPPALEAFSPEPTNPTEEATPELDSTVLEVVEHRLQSPVLFVEHRSQFPIVDLDEPTQELAAVAQSPTLDVLHSPTIQHEKAESLLRIEESKICSSLPEEFSGPDSPFYQQPINLSNDFIAEATPPERVQSPLMDLLLSPSAQIKQPLESHSPIPTAQSPIIPLPQELDSPVDDVTSSVKDSPLPVASPTEKPTFESPLCLGDDAFINQETESVTTIDVNSFLERSLVPDIASPLSGDETQFIGVCNTGLDVSNEYVMENVEIKSEIIAPEFPVETVTTPSEESKTEDIKNEETHVVSIIAPIAAVTAVTAIAAATAVAEKKPASKPKTTLAAKKPLSKPTTTATKPLSKAPAPKSAPLKTTLTVTKPKTSATTTKTTPKEKTPTISEKKPVLNGDAKPLVKKVPSTTSAPRQLITKSVPARLSSTKTGESKTTPRPTTTSSTTARLASKAPATRTPPIAAKTATSKPLTNSSATKTTGTVPKPKPSTMASKPSTMASKSTTVSPKPKPLAPDTKKQIKETMNKQITSATNPSSGLVTTKTSSVGSTLSKTTTKETKKPTELVRHLATTKPKTTGIVKKKTVANGVPTKVTTTTTITKTSLITDISPLIENNIIDNSQALEINNVAD